MSVLDFTARALRERDLRRHFLPEAVCTGPNWDILVFLGHAYATGRAVSTGDAAVCGGEPRTTGLRFLDKLFRDGLVERAPDEKDGRRILIQLTSKGWEAMEAYVERVAA